MRAIVVLSALALGQAWPAPALAQTTSTCVAPGQLVGVRPGADDGPTEVAIGVYLLDLIEIKDADQVFDADMVVSMSWRDPRLVDDELGQSLVNCRVPLDAIWNPRATIVNERDIKKRVSDVATVEPDGTVRHSQRYIGEFSVPLDLRSFPFDEQVLDFEFVASGNRPDELVFVLDRENSGVLGSLSIADWSVGETGYDVEPFYIPPQDDYRSRISFFVGVKRNTGYYVWKIFFPLSMIVFMSWAVFFIKPNVLPAQIGVSTSAVLTLIAFLFSLGQILPRLSYLTRADQFVIGSVLLVFGAFAEALVTTSLANRGREALALRIDRVSRFVFPAVFLVLVLLSLVIGFSLIV